MMYNAGIVAVIKHNGKILRENSDFVYLPFNSEYSILLKNLETRKAVIKISIDGTDVLDGNSLIINPNSELELEGFMKGTKAKNKFKFIKKTNEISEYRGDKIDDGIIRIEYWFEQIIINEPIKRYDIWYTTNNWNPTYTNALNCFDSSNFIVGSSCQCNCNVQDEGITVKGTEVNQNFNYGYTNKLEENSRVIILKLIGIKEDGNIIKEPITIQTKKICVTCGKKSKSNLKYCSTCGTFLE